MLVIACQPEPKYEPGCIQDTYIINGKPVSTWCSVEPPVPSERCPKPDSIKC